MSCQLCVYYKPLHVTVKHDHDRVTNVAKAGDKHNLLFILNCLFIGHISKHCNIDVFYEDKSDSTAL